MAVLEINVEFVNFYDVAVKILCYDGHRIPTMAVAREHGWDISARNVARPFRVVGVEMHFGDLVKYVPMAAPLDVRVSDGFDIRIDVDAVWNESRVALGEWRHEARLV